MSDGAHLGVGAERALETVMGGEQPTAEERETADQMRERILAATDTNTYDGAATYAARLVLEWLLADPSRAQDPSETEYEKGADGRMLWPAVVLRPGWYERMKEEGSRIDQLGLTGFMWGWAVNAARRCLELPPVANPAIITMGSETP